MTPTEQDLFRASMAIGLVVDMNGTATTAIAEKINATGKRPYDLTVRELLSIIDSTDPK